MSEPDAYKERAMTLLPVAPTTMGGVLKNAWRLYRAVLPRSLPLVLLAVMALSELSSAMLPPEADQWTLDDLDAIRGLFLSPRIWLASAGVVAITILINNAIFLIADATAQGRRLSLLAATGGALSRWLPALAVGVVFAVLVGIGTLLLVLPGMYLWGVYQFAFVAVAIEGSSTLQSLRISRQLVQGHWFRTTTLVSIGVMILYLLVTLAEVAVGAVTLLAGLGVHGILVAQQILLGVLDLFMLPFVPALMLCTYYDLKLRHGNPMGIASPHAAGNSTTRQ